MDYQKSMWKEEFVQYNFVFEGREAIVVCPAEEKKNGKWLLKTEYFYAFQDLELALVREGFHLAYLANTNRWGPDADLDTKPRFRNFIMAEFGLNSKCVPIGMSAGGLHAIKLAARHPEMVGAVYLDAPVVNLLSCPFGMGAGSTVGESAQLEVLSGLGLTRSDLIAYRDHPLDKIATLIRERIPAVLVCGGKDESVVFEENGLYIKQAYENSDIPFLFQFKPEDGHHPHGPADMRPVVEFLSQF